MKKLFSILSLFIFLSFSQSNSIDFKSFLGDGDKGIGILLSDIEFRKKQKEDLENEKILLKRRSEDTNKTINNALGSVDDLIKDTQIKISESGGIHEDLLKRKLSALKERKENLILFQELLKEENNKIQKHIKLVEEIIAYLSNGASFSDEKIAYSWKDLSDAKNKLDQLFAEINSENLKKDRIKKNRASDKEEISSLKKEIESKNSDKDKISEELFSLAEKEEGAAVVAELKIKSDLIEQEIEYLREKIEVNGFRVDSYDSEEKYVEDFTFLLKRKINNFNNFLSRIQKKLIVDISDVEMEKSELDKATKKSLEDKNKLIKEKDDKKISKDELVKRIRTLEKQIDQLQASGEGKSIESYLVDSALSVAKNEKMIVDKEVDLIDTRKEHIEIQNQLRQLKFQIIDVLHFLGINKEKIDEWLIDFRNKKKSAEYAKKVLKDKRDEITNSISDINLIRDSLQEKQKEVSSKKDVLFKKFPKQYLEVQSNFKKADSLLANQKLIVERHFSKISELLMLQEEVIKQCEFILKYLETNRVIGIWKRSDKAISVEQFIQSVYEAELFFKRLFWDTPNYLSPFEILKSIKSMVFLDYLSLLVLILSFVFFFFFSRMLLVYLYEKSGHFLRGLFGGVSDNFITGFSHVIESVIKFVIDNFVIFFTWLFILIHIGFDLSYFKIFTNPYFISLFHLISIPFLIYLSNEFIDHFEKLNKRLNFVIVQASQQDKIYSLVRIFLYATSILLPLRRSFMNYFERDGDFSPVILAAYTLISLVIVLLFFNKEDILRLFSSPNTFVVWFRKKIDTYYYPVFTFVIFLLILSNPYIGYSSLAWYLVFAVPASIAVLYGLFFFHYIVRHYSLFFFIQEEDDELLDKFEHAKTYYSFFIALTFIFLSLIAMVFLVRVWGFEGYTLYDLWHALSDEWTIKVGQGPSDKLGFIDLIKFVMFIASGFFISSLFNKFVLIKLFDVFKTELGAQNTIAKILHYVIISLAVIFAFTAVNLPQYSLAIGAALSVGIGFGLQHQISDYLAGFIVLLERPVEIGHYIETNGFRGKVHKISARSTTIKTGNNLFVTFPNRDLISKPIVNWGNGRYAVGCEVNVTVSYDSDTELVKETLGEVLKSHQSVLRAPAPVIRFEEFTDSSLKFYARPYISARRASEVWGIRSDLRFAILKTFKEKGIVIPFPQTVVHFAGKEQKPNLPNQDDNNPVEVKIDGE